MTEVELPYGEGSVAVRLPAGLAVEVVAPPVPSAAPPEADVVEAALDAPVGSKALEEAARGRRSVTIVVPDRTRPARTAVYLPPILARLERAGIPPGDVRILVGGGIHAPVTPREAADIVGPDVTTAHPTGPSAPDDPEANADLAPDAAIPSPRVHRWAAEADLVLLTGAVAPHYLAGFSGGPKALVPGAADRDTVLAAHRLTLDATVRPDGSVRSWLARTEGNPFRDVLLRIARRLGTCWTLAVGLSAGRIVHARAGEVGEAHDAACREHRARFGCPRPEPADLVIAGGGAPRDRDLLQAHKALVVAAEVAKPGAPIVWLAHARDGAGHPRFLPWFEAGRPERHLAALRRDFHPYGLTAYAFRWKCARHPVHAVSTQPAAVLAPMGLLPFADAQAAVDRALEGRRVERCVVLPRAAETFFA